MRRLMLGTAITAGALVLLGSAWWLGGWGDARHWPIRWLEVAGDLERVTAAQVRAAAAQQAGEGFFGIDVDTARAAVEALPWVAGATVSRRWPDALYIEIRERRAVARWNGDALIGASGARFEVAGTGGMQGLVELEGPEARLDEVFRRWRETASRLGPAGLEIRRVALDPRGSWRLELRGGHELLLGREALDERLQRYLAIRRGLQQAGPIARVDLRYPNGVAVTRRAPASEDENATGPLAEGRGRRSQTPGAQPNHG
jgi:cell division protein FtsQ